MVYTFRSCLMWMLMAGMAVNVGCSSLTHSKDKNKKDSAWSFFKKKEYQLPQTINVTWVHDILTKPGKPPTRGFGGRFYFYNEKSQAIPVEGELTVYGFDDTHKSHEGMSIEGADKKFKFTAEQFTTHFSESDLGASYSVWIPWDTAPGDQKRIMLIPTFQTKEGRVIRGNAAILILPGRQNPLANQRVIQASANATPTYGVAQADYSQQPGQEVQPRTTTIQVPARSIRTQPQLSSDQANQLIERANRGELSAPSTHGNPASPVMHSVELPTPTAPTAPSAAVGVPPQQNSLSTAASMSTRAPEGSMTSRQPFPQIFQPPAGMPVPTTSLDANVVNGWVQPEFARASWTGLSAHSGQSPHPAPSSPVAPSASYPRP